MKRKGDALKRLNLIGGIAHLGPMVALSCTPWTRKDSGEPFVNRDGVPLWNVKVNTLMGGHLWVRVPAHTRPAIEGTAVELQGLVVRAWNDELRFEAASITAALEESAKDSVA
jgi:hypothetical protein